MPEPDSPAISVRTLLLRTKAFVVFNNDFAGNDLLLQLLALIHNILWELISQSFLHDGKSVRLTPPSLRLKYWVVPPSKVPSTTDWITR